MMMLFAQDHLRPRSLPAYKCQHAHARACEYPRTRMSLLAVLLLTFRV